MFIIDNPNHLLTTFYTRCIYMLSDYVSNTLKSRTGESTLLIYVIKVINGM